MYVSGSSSGNYITGMASGMDVDTMVKNLMDAERISYDTYYQEMQYYEWKLEAYQETTSSIKSFEESYFDYTNPDTNLLSDSTYLSYDCTSSASGVSAEVLDGSIANDQYTIEVEQKAAAAVVEGSSGVSSPISGSQIIDYALLEDQVMTVELDGVEKDITIVDLDVSGHISIEDIQLAIDASFGPGKVLVSDTSGYFEMDTIENSGSHEVYLSGDALTSLGFESSDSVSNRISTLETLAEVSTQMTTPFAFDADGMVTMTVNDVLFEFSSSTSLETMMETINNDVEAGVTLTYDSLNDSFAMEADQTGAGSTITLSESGSDFLQSLGLTLVTEGQDAIVEINGDKIVRSDNNIEMDGVSFNITEVTTDPIIINIEMDTDVIYDTVVDFVASYNEMIDDIEAKINEDRDYDYDPLTEAQKDEMSEDEIETWQNQVKVGLLSNDKLLDDMLSEMRQALYSSVEGMNLSLADIGIKTDSYETGGKLVLDDSKLQEVIKESPIEVVELFTKKSTSHPATSNRTLDSDEIETRYKEEGLMFRLYDISQSYVSTTSDKNGNKGLLIEKCGFSDDYSEVSSTMYQHLEDMESKLLEMEDDLSAKEEQYYSKFSVMETYMSQMSSQMQMVQSWFT